MTSGRRFGERIQGNCHITWAAGLPSYIRQDNQQVENADGSSGINDTYPYLSSQLHQ